jgi:hypothetical protein
MQVQSPVSIAARRPADHLRRYWQYASRSGPEMSAPSQVEIFACADRMEASRTSAEFEQALSEAHRLGVFPYSHDVSEVARASVLYAD